jgi:hypothetical protein
MSPENILHNINFQGPEGTRVIAAALKLNVAALIIATHELTMIQVYGIDGADLKPLYTTTIHEKGRRNDPSTITLERIAGSLFAIYAIDRELFFIRLETDGGYEIANSIVVEKSANGKMLYSLFFSFNVFELLKRKSTRHLENIMCQGKEILGYDC